MVAQRSKILTTGNKGTEHALDCPRDSSLQVGELRLGFSGGILPEDLPLQKGGCETSARSDREGCDGSQDREISSQHTTRRLSCLRLGSNSTPTGISLTFGSCPTSFLGKEPNHVHDHKL